MGPARFHHDLADPLSYLTELELRATEAEVGVEVTRVPLELRPPPEPLVDVAGPRWTERIHTAAATAAQLGVLVRAPTLVPWTRKAHELVLHAEQSQRADEARLAIYRALFERGEDIGRVDVLVELAAAVGLDRTEAKAVLDVDRYAEEVGRALAEARAGGLAEPPVLRSGEARLEGFHNRDALRTFLASHA